MRINLSNMFSKVRSNVILLGFMMVGLTGGLMYGLFQWMATIQASAFVEGAIVGGLVALFLTVIGVSIGALASTMSQVANDPAPPSIPESSVVAMMEKFIEMKDK